MAYAGNSHVLLYGGDGFQVFDDTWAFDVVDATWTQESPATSPGRRSQHAMAYAGLDRVLLFGGIGDSARRFTDTWLHDRSDNTWTRVATGGPTNRSVTEMAYIGSDKVLLYGGRVDGSSQYNHETWVFDVSDRVWTRVKYNSLPGSRTGHAMAWLGGDRVVLYGGRTGSSYTATDPDTYVFDLGDTSWTQLNTANEPPIGTVGAEMEYAGNNIAILVTYGGSGSNLSHETWKFISASSTWARVADESAGAVPSGRQHFGLGMSSSQRSRPLVLFGGKEDGLLLRGDTWTYGPRPHGGVSP
jgi:N-acetylneuraminic acid mutarotase